MASPEAWATPPRWWGVGIISLSGRATVFTPGYFEAAVGLLLVVMGLRHLLD